MRTRIRRYPYSPACRLAVFLASWLAIVKLPLRSLLTRLGVLSAIGLSRAGEDAQCVLISVSAFRLQDVERVAIKPVELPDHDGGAFPDVLNQRPQAGTVIAGAGHGVGEKVFGPPTSRCKREKYSFRMYCFVRD